MQKTILITGSTDGIGFQTAKRLISEGHNVLIHGRSEEKVKKVVEELSLLSNGGTIDSFVADLSNMSDVKALANVVKESYSKLDALINNAGVYKVSEVKTKDNLDVRFVVNTIAPYLLTKELMPLLDTSSRVVNLSSAAQAPVNINAIKKVIPMSNGEAYAQSKLALTMWSTLLGLKLKGKGPLIVSVNPKSLLGSKMVKAAYGIDGGDLSIGADILCRAALSDEFANANGKYFDNDIAEFAQAHSEALDEVKCKKVIEAIEEVLLELV